MIANSRYIREISEYLKKQERPSFVFDALTIIDFYYFENIKYLLAGFS